MKRSRPVKSLRRMAAERRAAAAAWPKVTQEEAHAQARRLKAWNWQKETPPDQQP